MSRRDRVALAIALVEEHLRARNLAPFTIDRTRTVVVAFLGFIGKTPLSAIGVDDVRGYLASRYKAGLAAGTQANDLTALRRLFRALVLSGRAAHDPTTSLRVAVNRERPRVVLSKDSVARLLGAALAPREGYWRNESVRLAIRLRDRACLELLYGVGLRASEAQAVRVLDLDLTEGTLMVRRAKRGISRALALPKAALPHLDRYLREGRPALMRSHIEDGGFFLLGQYGRPLGKGAVFVLVKNLSERSGVRVHPHAVRRSLASHLVRDGANVLAIKELLGHADLRTTAEYLHLDRADLHRAVSVLDANV